MIKESLWSQWWVKLGVWIILFSCISQLSPTPVIPAAVFVVSIIYFIAAMLYGRRGNNQEYYYRSV